ncbi:hypothetical protein [Paenibacillus roseipurpureus]|uniref:YjzC family protein n=1 Tax=Paenibacillus roseopurpureus TaxID=2918901 RepID=A0AA96RMT3_9BACL|nr:hypothetical protein [Paenibacillus sp. MBLB1832]WNR44647.1 hypothetical protein MJB10_00315 [Paenibacillus sp. MBLB1832]
MSSASQSSHQHKTNDKVTETGRYRDADGQSITLTAGDTFPPCPKTGQSTIWHHA